MLLQTDKNLNLENEIVSESGCYFISLLSIVEHFLNIEMKPKQINEIKNLCIKKGLMKNNLYIKDPFKILNLSFKYLRSNNKAIKDKKNYMFTIIKSDVKLYKKTGNHFCSGNKYGEILFNPDPRVKMKNLRVTRKIKII